MSAPQSQWIAVRDPGMRCQRASDRMFQSSRSTMSSRHVRTAPGSPAQQTMSTASAAEPTRSIDAATIAWSTSTVHWYRVRASRSMNRVSHRARALQACLNSEGLSPLAREKVRAGGANSFRRSWNSILKKLDIPVRLSDRLARTHRRTILVALSQRCMTPRILSHKRSHALPARSANRTAAGGFLRKRPLGINRSVLSSCSRSATISRVSRFVLRG